MPEEKKEPRPNGTTMEGMIWNANHVLESAMSPHINGLPKALFRNCVGIILVCTGQMGFLLSGTTGTGIAMKKTSDGKWSPPCAVGLTGIGFGILIGASIRDLVVFVMDDITMDALGTKHGVDIKANLEVTVGFGRAATTGLDFTKKGVGATFAIAYSKGAFAGLSVDGASVGTREFVNNKFYSEVTTGKEIMDGKFPVPADKVTMIQEVYDKLEKLSEGKTEEPSEAEQAKKSAAKEAADKEHETVADSPEVVKVDAEAEAAKESA